MAGSKENLFTGFSIVFGTSGFSADITGASRSGISRDSIPTSHAGTAAPSSSEYGNMTFMPAALSDGGELNLDIAFDPDEEPPIDQPAETITITYAKLAADASAATEAFSGFCTNYEFSGELGGKWTGSITIKVTGNVTQTAAA